MHSLIHENNLNKHCISYIEFYTGNETFYQLRNDYIINEEFILQSKR